MTKGIPVCGNGTIEDNCRAVWIYRVKALLSGGIIMNDVTRKLMTVQMKPLFLIRC